MIMKTNEPYDEFLAALKHEISKGGYGSKYSLSIATGLTSGFISQILSEKKVKKAGREAQYKIAKALGYDYLDFIKLGRTLLEAESALALSDTVDVEVRRNGKVIPPPDPPVPLASVPNNVHLLPAREKPPPTHEEQQAQAMRDNLEIIIKSGDAEIIESIRSNLVTFKRTVELAMEIRTLKAENKDVRMTGGGYRRQGNLIVVEFCRGCYW
jgi:hypothetical protein